MKIRSLFRDFRVAAALLCLVSAAGATQLFAADAGPTTNVIVPGAGEKWAATWATGMGGTFPGSAALSFAIPNPTTDGANEQTFRMMVKPDLWGRSMRFKFSNVFGTQPVTFGRATVGLADLRRERFSRLDHVDQLQRWLDQRDHSRRPGNFQ